MGVARLKSRIWRTARPRKGPCFLAIAVGGIRSALRDLRDRALIATLTYSFARITAALKVKVEDLRPRRADKFLAALDRRLRR